VSALGGVGGGTALPSGQIVAPVDPLQLQGGAQAGRASAGTAPATNQAIMQLLSGAPVGGVDPELFREEARASFAAEESGLGDRIDEIAHRFGRSGRTISEASEAYGDFASQRALGVAQAGRSAAELNSRAAQVGAGLQVPGVQASQGALAQLLGTGGALRGVEGELRSEDLFRTLAAQTPNPMNALVTAALGIQPFGTFAASGPSETSQVLSGIGSLLGGIGGIAGGFLGG
jgi:hypothetical protein